MRTTSLTHGHLRDAGITVTAVVAFSFLLVGTFKATTVFRDARQFEGAR
jgi:hypothetical protein